METTDKFFMKLQNSGSSYLEALKTAKGQFKNMLPEVKEAKQRELMFVAQTMLSNSISKVITSIKDEIALNKKWIWRKSFPKLSSEYSTDKVEASNQIASANNVLQGEKSDKEILYFLELFLNSKMFDSAFIIHDQVMARDGKESKPLQEKVKEMMLPIKTELGIIENEDRVKELEAFLPNVQMVLTILINPGFDLGNTHVRDIHTEIKRTMKELWPELWSYILQKSYPKQQLA